MSPGGSRMKVLAYIVITLLFAATIALGIYSAIPEPENEPVVSYITPESNSSSVSSAVSSNNNNSTSSKHSQTSRPASSSSSTKSESSSESSCVELSLNINTATEEELLCLEGITSEDARLIVLYREMAGGYSSIEELMLVKGISVNQFRLIKDDIYCE